MSAEADFIGLLQGIATDPAARGLSDDCAVLEIGSETLILTHDAMAEGVHFLPDADPADVAWKLVTTNLSDLAAKGAVPIGVLLGYTLGENDARFVAGLKEALESYDIRLLGGDTISSTSTASHGLTAIGRATHTPVPSRGGAQAGDSVYVTGTLGMAMIGLEEIQSGARADTENSLAYRRPRPLLKEGQALVPHVTAMMDVSDGLLLDAYRMAQASGVTVALDSAAIPAADQSRFDECIRWGDDYALLFTLPEGAKCPVQAHKIGRAAVQGDAPILLDTVPLTGQNGLGYQHH